LTHIDNGLEKPFLSLMGLTTPNTFESTVTREQATNGFIGRSLIIRQLNDNPKAIKRFKKLPMPFGMSQTIAGIYNGGDFDANETRVEYYSQRIKVVTSKEAADMLDGVQDWVWAAAELERNTSGLEAIIRRGYELVAKISLILAAPSGRRTEEHVRWAFAMIRGDLKTKIDIVHENDEEKTNPAQVLRSKILGKISEENGETLPHFCNRIRKFKKAAIEGELAKMVSEGIIRRVEETHPVNGKQTIKYYSLGD
jgi:hypothetical protein